MELALLPLHNDDVLRVRSDGPVSCRRSDDPLQVLLGPHCYARKVLLNLDRSPSIDTSGVCWLMESSKRFAEAGGKLVLYALTPLVFDVLAFLRLTPLLHIAPHEQAAHEMLVGAARDPLPAERRSESALRFPR